ncbi:MAG: phosphoribosylamine--glycine ligase [Clostridia bacterium]|nr:phosphoribosylamine--glycine ligase [Clostridia bacterium]
MNIMVIGSGGREHALVKAIKKNPLAEKIYALPGNGGMSLDCECVNIKATDLDSIVDFAIGHKIDFAVVAPDDPLALGLVDRLHDAGIKCFGPTAKAARIEASKVFAKELMKEYSIPTARYETFCDPEKAMEYIDSQCAGKAANACSLVVKADGLALGKGVIICATREEAKKAIKDIMIDRAFGKSGERVVIEEYLEGPEVSILAFTDGETVVPLVSSMDHKRALDEDKGLNTGGMGAVAPNPYYTEEIAEICMRDIFMPTIRAMNARGATFRGCLYFGLMLTKDGPRVIEYNCRFGDPETQVVLPLLKSDLLDIMMAVEDSRLKDIEVEMSRECACCVIKASAGYPEAYEKGKLIEIGDTGEALVFHSGTRLENGRFYTNGGRVIGVTATAATLGDAVKSAYEAIDKISFDGAFCRRDIGAKALKAKGRQEGLWY